jgi:hypothetical protein
MAFGGSSTGLYRVMIQRVVSSLYMLDWGTTTTPTPTPTPTPTTTPI